MATKLFNLDALPTREERVLVFKGVSHAMVPMSVGDFIENTKLMQDLRGGSENNAVMGLAGEFQVIVDMVSRVFPTVDQSDLLTLTFEQLNALLAFARGQDLADQVKEQSQEGDQGN